MYRRQHPSWRTEESFFHVWLQYLTGVAAFLDIAWWDYQIYIYSWLELVHVRLQFSLLLSHSHTHSDITLSRYKALRDTISNINSDMHICTSRIQGHIFHMPGSQTNVILISLIIGLLIFRRHSVFRSMIARWYFHLYIPQSRNVFAWPEPTVIYSLDARIRCYLSNGENFIIYSALTYLHIPNPRSYIVRMQGSQVDAMLLFACRYSEGTVFCRIIDPWLVILLQISKSKDRQPWICYPACYFSTWPKRKVHRTSTFLLYHILNIYSNICITVRRPWRINPLLGLCLYLGKSNCHRLTHIYLP